MTGPVGRGERRNPPGRNTLLTTVNLRGQRVRTPLWINQFATDLNLQIDTAQLRSRVSHRPIRLSERFVNFSTIWNVADRDKYERLIRTLKEHWARNLNEDTPTPMRLQYYGANKTWRGFIEEVGVGYAVTDVILTYPFMMRVIPDVADQVSRITGKQDVPYAPTSQDVRDFGNRWYSTRDFKRDLSKERRRRGQTGKNPDDSRNPTNTGKGQQR